MGYDPAKYIIYLYMYMYENFLLKSIKNVKKKIFKMSFLTTKNEL
jgi:hypothetical protein